MFDVGRSDMKMKRTHLYNWFAAASLLASLCLWVCLLPAGVSADTDAAEADIIPWSGWWWPSRFGGLATGVDYNGHPAPLEKYDLLTTGGYPAEATQYYLDTEFNPDALSWNGLCQAYASAAVSEPIAFYPSSYENIIFKVGDKKGLITACHEYDQRQYGNPEDPADFHYWLLNYIKDQGRAFYAELDPSEEVWNFPVYGYQMESTRNGSLMEVACTIWYASDFVDPDYQGTEALSKTYTYTLVLSGDEIVGGEWTGNSVYDRPQQIVMPLGLGTYNPYLDYALVRDIAVSRDDPHEAQEPAELLPGGYNQVLADQDSYTLSTQIGEQIFLAVENLDTLQEGILVSVLDKDRHLIAYTTVDKAERGELCVYSQNPPYTLNIQRSDYSQTGYYRLECDLERTFTFYNPNVQKGYGWGGFAISNDGDTTAETVLVTGYDRQGRPLQTYIGPFEMAPGAKRIVQVSDFKVRMVERDALYGVKIHATRPLSVVSLTGYYDTNMSATQATGEGNTFVVPDTQAGMNLTKSVSWGLYNRSGTALPVAATHYSESGALIDSAQIDLNPRQASHYNPGSQPLGTMTTGGWIGLETTDSDVLGGYTQWLANNLKYSERLPLLTPATRFFVPHVVGSAAWANTLVLINADADSNDLVIKLLDDGTVAQKQVTLAPHEKRTLSVSGLFEEVAASALNLCGLSVDAGRPLAGYTIFETANDHLYFPLIEADQATSSMTLGHVACNGYWWTCVNLFNPSETQAASLRLTPYDNQGVAMTGSVRQRTLPALKKDVFTAYDLWGAAADGIGMVKIEVIDGPPVVGLSAYGNMENSMAAGILFKKKN